MNDLKQLGLRHAISNRLERIAADAAMKAVSTYFLRNKQAFDEAGIGDVECVQQLIVYSNDPIPTPDKRHLYKFDDNAGADGALS